MLASGRLCQVDHFRDLAPSRLGAVYRGTVRRVDPGLNAAFVELGGGWSRDGLLRARDAGPKGGPKRIQQIVQEGAALIVQITGGNAAQVRPGDAASDLGDAAKGPAVSAAITLSHGQFDYLPNRRGLVLAPEAELTAVDRDRLNKLLGDLLQAGEGLKLAAPAARAYADARLEGGSAERAWTAQIAKGLGELRRHWHAAKQVAASSDRPTEIGPAPGPVAQFLGLHAHQGVERIVAGDAQLLGAANEWAREFWPQLAPMIQRAAPDRDLFEANDIDTEIEAALNSRVSFADGANLVIETGETLTAVDVNSGGRAGKAGRQALDINRLAVAEIARQLRLRAISGPVVIDLLKMPRAADRELVADAMAQAVGDDPARCHIAGYSPLGHLELTRQRRGPSLAERMSDAPAQPGLGIEAACYSALRQATRPGRVPPGGRVLRVSAQLERLLNGPLRAAVDDAGTRIGAALKIEVAAHLHGPAFDYRSDAD